MEPLSVAVHAVANVGGLRTGQNVLIMGAGPVGLLAMGVAKGLGAGRIIGVDINQDRLNFAKSYAATDTYIPVSGTEHATQHQPQHWGQHHQRTRWRLQQLTTPSGQAGGQRVSPRVFPPRSRRPPPHLRHPRSWPRIHRSRHRRDRSGGVHPDGSQRCPTRVSERIHFAMFSLDAEDHLTLL